MSAIPLIRKKYNHKCFAGQYVTHYTVIEFYNTVQFKKKYKKNKLTVTKQNKIKNSTKKIQQFKYAYSVTVYHCNKD